MAPRSTKGNVAPAGWQRRLFLAVSVFTYLLITMGGTVCMTESGQGCPDWPGCYGRAVPPPRLDAIIEYTHRFIAALTTPLIVASAIVAWRSYPSRLWIRRPPALAIVFVGAVIVFGALAVLRGLSPAAAALDLGSALIVLALMVTATVVAFRVHADPMLPGRLSLRSPFAKWTLGTLLAVLAVLVSAVLVARGGSSARCLGLPLYAGPFVPTDVEGVLPMARRLLSAIASLSVIALAVQARRARGAAPGVRSVATALAALVLAETGIGVLLALGGPAQGFMVAYTALAAAIWGLVVALFVLVAVTSPVPLGAHAEAGMSRAETPGTGLPAGLKGTT